MPPTRTRAALCLCALVALAAGACSDDEADAPPSSEERSAAPGDIPGTVPDAVARMEDRQWLLDPSASSAGPAGDLAVTLRLQLGEVVGSGGCTTFQGPVETDGTSFAAGPFTRTVVDCAPDVEQAEDDFLDALAAVRSARLDGDTLVLEGPDDVVLTFRTEAAVDELGAADLVGRWEIEAIGDPSAGGLPPVEGTDPLLVFQGDGQLAGVLGCNTLSGRWALDGASLALADLGTTKTRCDEPVGVGDQERAVLDALAAVDGTEWAGGEGLVLTGGGDTLIVLRRSP